MERNLKCLTEEAEEQEKRASLLINRQFEENKRALERRNRAVNEEKIQADLKREETEEERNSADLQKEPAEVENKKADFTAEVAKVVYDDDDIVIPNRGRLNKEARDTPWTSITPRVPSSAVEDGTSTESDDEDKFEKGNLTQNVTRDLSPKMSRATMSTKNGENPKRKLLTQVEAEAAETVA